MLLNGARVQTLPLLWICSVGTAEGKAHAWNDSALTSKHNVSAELVLALPLLFLFFPSLPPAAYFIPPFLVSLLSSLPLRFVLCPPFPRLLSLKVFFLFLLWVGELEWESGCLDDDTGTDNRGQGVHQGCYQLHKRQTTKQQRGAPRRVPALAPDTACLAGSLKRGFRAQKTEVEVCSFSFLQMGRGISWQEPAARLSDFQARGREEGRELAIWHQGLPRY